MSFLWLLLLSWAVLPRPAFAVVEVGDSTATFQAAPSTAVPVAQEEEHISTSEESETKGIIPLNAVSTSTRPITPVSSFPEKNPYDQAREELIRALELWNSGHAEAASDKALEAYDDFTQLRRVPGVKRSKIQAQKYQAASVYIEAGIAYVKKFVQRMGSSPDAIEEGRSRLEDLRDVARNYPDLNKMLNNAINQLSSSPAGLSKQ